MKKHTPPITPPISLEKKTLSLEKSKEKYSESVTRILSPQEMILYIKEKIFCENCLEYRSGIRIHLLQKDIKTFLHSIQDALEELFPKDRFHIGDRTPIERMDPYSFRPQCIIFSITRKTPPKGVGEIKVTYYNTRTTFPPYGQVSINLYNTITTFTYKIEPNFYFHNEDGEDYQED